VSDWGKLSAVNTLQSNGLVWPDSQSDEETAPRCLRDLHLAATDINRYMIVNPIVTSTPPGLPFPDRERHVPVARWKDGTTHSANGDVCSKLFAQTTVNLRPMPTSSTPQRWSSSLRRRRPFVGGKARKR
jgi:hypothetical protein